VISGFPCIVNEILALLECYAASRLVTDFSRPICCPKMSVNNYQSAPRIIAEKPSSHNDYICLSLASYHLRSYCYVPAVNGFLRVREMKALCGVRVCPCVRIFYLRSCSAGMMKMVVLVYRGCLVQL
jgi:hypothetical protein